MNSMYLGQVNIITFLLFLVVVVCCTCTKNAFGFNHQLLSINNRRYGWMRKTTTTTRSTITTKSSTIGLLSKFNNDDNDFDDDDYDDGYGEQSMSMSESERMDMVRKLQKSFYSNSNSATTTDGTAATFSSSSTSTTTTTATSSTSKSGNTNAAAYALLPPSPKLDESTGIMYNLPLWRVNWVEVPGRTNCLNVHEGQYTHMFETILNSATTTDDDNGSSRRPTLYVGHLHLPGGFKMTRTGLRQYDLKSWKDEIQDKDRYATANQRSAVIGSLMEITDYRRLQDGRLCIFVNVIERFVVDSIVQSFPYSIANVQILPDIEEISTTLIKLNDENFSKLVRGTAVTKSFQYHQYEYSKIQLPLTKKGKDDDGEEEYLSTDAIDESAISKLLPFATYALNKESSLDDIVIDAEDTTSNDDSANDDDNDTTILEGFSGGSPSLEHQLEIWRILKNPPTLEGCTPKQNIDLNGLETMIWLQLEELIQKTGFILPNEILTLQPPHMMDYLELNVPVRESSSSTIPSSKPTILSSKYPAYRRQKRLSYALPGLLEGTEFGTNMRQVYLNTPSTKARLEAILQRLERLNASMDMDDDDFQGAFE